MSRQFHFFKINEGTDLNLLREQYLVLCKQYHPDKGGNESVFKSMKSEYEYAQKFIENGNHLKPPNSKQSKQLVTQRQLLDDVIQLLEHVRQKPGEFDGKTLKKELKKIGIKTGINFLKNLL